MTFLWRDRGKHDIQTTENAFQKRCIFRHIYLLCCIVVADDIVHIGLCHFFQVYALTKSFTTFIMKALIKKTTETMMLQRLEMEVISCKYLDFLPSTYHSISAKQTFQTIHKKANEASWKKKWKPTTRNNVGP